jgi:hypothetical protein
MPLYDLSRPRSLLTAADSLPSFPGPTGEIRNAAQRVPNPDRQLTHSGLRQNLLPSINSYIFRLLSRGIFR